MLRVSRGLREDGCFSLSPMPRCQSLRLRCQQSQRRSRRARLRSRCDAGAPKDRAEPAHSERADRCRRDDPLPSYPAIHQPRCERERYLSLTRAPQQKRGMVSLAKRAQHLLFRQRLEARPIACVLHQTCGDRIRQPGMGCTSLHRAAGTDASAPGTTRACSSLLARTDRRAPKKIAPVTIENSSTTALRGSQGFLGVIENS